MNEVEVGEYVRTKTGYICILIKIGKDLITVGHGMQEIKLYAKFSNSHIIHADNYQELYKNINKYIVKHSKILAEVVEVGDYVNGKRIYKIDKGKNYCYLYYGNCKTFVDYQIKTIWTKEKLKYIEYDVGRLAKG